MLHPQTTKPTASNTSRPWARQPRNIRRERPCWGILKETAATECPGIAALGRMNKSWPTRGSWNGRRPFYGKARETCPWSYKKIMFERAAHLLIVWLFVFSCEKSHQGGRYLFGCVRYLARYPNTSRYQNNTCKVRISQPRWWGFSSSGIWGLMVDWLTLQKMAALRSFDTSDTTHITLFSGSRPQWKHCYCQSCASVSTQSPWFGTARYGPYEALSSSQHVISLKMYTYESEYTAGPILRARPLLTQPTDNHKIILYCALDNYDSPHFVRSYIPQNYEKYQIIQATDIKIIHYIKWENKHSVAI
jgi:hypothetical protein